MPSVQPVTEDDTGDISAPSLDPITGTCTPEAADLYVARNLASYPEVNDLYASSAKVAYLKSLGHEFCQELRVLVFLLLQHHCSES